MGFAAWTLGCLLVVTVGTVVTAPVRRARLAARRTVLRAWARGVLRLLGVRLTVNGALPAAPFFLVSNHLSYLDIVAYAAVLPARFVAKREVRSWPGLGILARAGGTIFIDRDVKRDAVRVQDDLTRAAADGDGVVVFAEATSTAGQGVLPFRPALLEWAARHRHPVHYASIGYRTPSDGPPAHLSVCWWGEMTFGDHFVGLCRLRAIDARIMIGESPITEPDRKRLASRLHQAVSEQFIPVVME